MPPRSRADRLLIAFLWGAAVFCLAANVLPWTVIGDPPLRPGHVEVLAACPPTTTGPAWLFASQMLETLAQGTPEKALVMGNLIQFAALAGFACLVGHYAYGWRGHDGAGTKR
jgi:hypothetical protein